MRNFLSTNEIHTEQPPTLPHDLTTTPKHTTEDESGLIQGKDSGLSRRGPSGQTTPGEPQEVDEPQKSSSPTLNRAERREAVKDDRKVRQSYHHRRKFCESVNANPTLCSVTKEVAVAITSFSDDAGKPAYPSQVRLADRLHLHKRTVGRAVQELETAGYLYIRRCSPKRDGRTGRYYRRFNNYYCFRLPKEPCQGRRVRRRRSSHLEDTGVPLTVIGRTSPLSGGGEGSGSGAVCPLVVLTPPPKPVLLLTNTVEMDNELLDRSPREFFAEMRAKLR